MASNRIAKAAHEVLRETETTTAPVPVFDIVRKLGIILRVGPLPEELSGFLVRKGGKVVIGVNSLHPKQRQAFTVAHELGHLRLHRDDSFVDRGFSFYFRNERSSQAVDQKEVQANQFAAELLMPAHLLEPLLNGRSVDVGDEHFINSLAKQFQVSSQAMTFRLINLGKARRDTGD